MPHAAVDTIRADNDSANCVIAMHRRLSEGMQCLVGKCCFLVLLLILATGLYFITTFFKRIWFSCVKAWGCPLTPPLNEKIDSGNSHLQDLARWWRTSKGVHIPKISQFYWGLFEKMRFFVFLHYKIKQNKSQIGPQIPLNLTSEDLKYPPEVRVQDETCITICGKPVQAIFDQKKLTGLAGGSGKVQILPNMGLVFGFWAL